MRQLHGLGLLLEAPAPALGPWDVLVGGKTVLFGCGARAGGVSALTGAERAETEADGCCHMGALDSVLEGSPYPALPISASPPSSELSQVSEPIYCEMSPPSSASPTCPVAHSIWLGISAP